MAFYLKAGNTYRVSSKEQLNLHENLPVGTYTVKYDERGGFYFLQEIGNFTLPNKLYGTTADDAARILTTFYHRKKSTGVMLNGEKGSGKTLLAEVVSVQAAASGVPTIVINDSHFGEAFNEFMQSIDQKVVVIFDEFEKVYDRNEQEALLTLFDGVYPSEKLFIITCNDKYRINEHMTNRPGRIYYRLDFGGLDADFIKEYCDDRLDDKSHTDDLLRLSTLFDSFNFDVLKAVVEEMNRYKETPQKALRMLNAKPEQSSSAMFDATLTDTLGKEIWSGRWQGNPLAGRMIVYYSVDSKSDPLAEWMKDLGLTTDSDGDGEILFSTDDIVSIDGGTGTFVLRNSSGVTLHLKRHITSKFDWSEW